MAKMTWKEFLLEWIPAMVFYWAVGGFVFWALVLN